MALDEYLIGADAALPPDSQVAEQPNQWQDLLRGTESTPILGRRVQRSCAHESSIE